MLGGLLWAPVYAGPTTVTIPEVSAGQGNGPETPMTFQIQRSGDLSYPVTLNLLPAADEDSAVPAVAGVDFVGGEMTVTVAAGASSATATVLLPLAPPAQPDRGLQLHILDVTVPLLGPRQDPCQTERPSSITVADLNRDGRLDIVTGENESGLLAVCMNRGSEDALAFSPAAPLVASAPGSSSPYRNIAGVASGDIDGDGAPDLIAADSSNNDLVLFLNRTPDFAADPAFADAVYLDLRNAAGPLAVFDMDGDGRLDLVAGGIVGMCWGPEDCHGEVYVFRNTTPPGAARATFEAVEPLRVHEFVQRIAVGDFNLDGRQDFATASLFGQVTVFSNTTPAPGALLTFSSTVPAQFSSAQDLVAADFDLDGRPDLAVVHERRGVSILFGSADAGGAGLAEPQLVFVEPTRPGQAEQPFKITAADFTGDGRLDIGLAYGMVHNDPPNDGWGLATVLINVAPVPAASRVLFAPVPEMSVGGLPFQLAAADVDGDAVPDLLAASMYNNVVSVHASTAIHLPTVPVRGTILATLPPLDFTPVTNAPVSSQVASEEVTISGIRYAAPVSVSGGTYTVNGGPPLSGETLVRAGDVVRVGLQSAGTQGTQSTADLVVGGVGGKFSATTATAESGNTSVGGAMPPAGVLLLLGVGLLRRRRARRY
jgi:hypothetical protein